MKRWSLVLASLSLSACVSAGHVTESIVGTHEIEMGKPGNSSRVVLDCTTDTSCTFTSISERGRSKHTDVLKNVRPVDNLTYAANALKHAASKQGETPRNQDAIAAMERLRPILTTNPTVSKCWDLNFTAPEYLLVCTLSNTPADAPSLFLFATLMASCNDVFCRYIIMPLERSKQKP